MAIAAFRNISMSSNPTAEVSDSEIFRSLWTPAPRQQAQPRDVRDLPAGDSEQDIFNNIFNDAAPARTMPRRSQWE
jgi:hypothetical protein